MLLVNYWWIVVLIVDRFLVVTGPFSNFWTLWDFDRLRNFYSNLKYLHVGISFPWQPMRSCFDFENMAERFPEWAWMLFTWIPSQCPHFTVKLLPYPSGFGCIIYCLAGENGQWVVKTPQPHSWMKLVALWENSRVHTCKLLNFHRRKSKCLNGFLCTYKCCLIINFY